MVTHSNVMVHGTKKIHGNEMAQWSEMVDDNSMTHSNMMVHGTKMIQGNEMAQWSEMVYGNEIKMVQVSGMVDGNETAQGNEMVQDTEFVNGNDTVQGNEMGQDTELVHANDIVTANDKDHGNAGMVQLQDKWPRGKTSLIWEHFTIEDTSGAGSSSQARCKHCGQSFVYNSGRKTSGTSHLKRHVTMGSCPTIRKEGMDGNPECPSKKSKRYNVYGNAATFDQDRSYLSLAKMIILHDYPLHIVQQPGFTAFLGGLLPRFRVGDVDTMEQEVHGVYQKEKDNLLQVFSNMPGRISLSIGSWITNQTLGYVSLSGQFIDSEWKMHRRMLNFTMVSSHSDHALTEAISYSLSDWNVKDKLFTITLDNDCSSHAIYSANLTDHLSKKNTLILKGHLFVVRCYARILNALAQDVIASTQGVIYNIRESIKFLKASSAREEKFVELVQQMEAPSTKTLTLDVTTQWDTTYHMLLAALDYRQAFTALGTCDDNYNEAPTADGWKKVEAACSYLKLLHDSARNIVVSAETPTSNMFFHDVCKLQLEISNATAHEDLIFSGIAKTMHEKLNRYWKDCNVMLAIAVTMDPRFKMKLVEFNYSKLYGVKAVKYVKVVDDALHDLYKEYAEQLEPSKKAPTNEKNAQVAASSAGYRFLDFDRYVLERASNQPSKSELGQYLEEAIMPRGGGFDILKWWKDNTLRFPTLSKMARDILAIPMSMVSSSSSVFSATGGGATRMLDDYRSSLRPETVEALFCANDWLQCSQAGCS